MQCLLLTTAHLADTDLVTYDDVLCIGKGWQDAGYSGQVICIDDGLLCLHELCQVLLQIQMHINGTIEAPWPTRANSIFVNGCCTGFLYPEPRLCSGATQDGVQLVA